MVLIGPGSLRARFTEIEESSRTVLVIGNVPLHFATGVFGLHAILFILLDRPDSAVKFRQGLQQHFRRLPVGVHESSLFHTPHRSILKRQRNSLNHPAVWPTQVETFHEWPSASR
jgi:hypothetical protein